MKNKISNSYLENKNKPLPNTKCRKCLSKNNKIQWGWAGVYYDMICEYGHIWKKIEKGGRNEFK